MALILYRSSSSQSSPANHRECSTSSHRLPVRRRWSRDGLSLVPFCFAPHYRSDHPESELTEKSVEYFIDRKIPFAALRDGEVYIEDLKRPR